MNVKYLFQQNVVNNIREQKTNHHFSLTKILLSQQNFVSFVSCTEQNIETNHSALAKFYQEKIFMKLKTITKIKLACLVVRLRLILLS